MTPKTVLVLQHVEPESPGRIERALESVGAGLVIVRIFKGDPVPAAIGDNDGLLIMGGPMSVYEQDRYPHLKAEIHLLQQAVEKRRPVLGTCLGSQLLAAALGAKVYPGKQKEIGWFPVHLSPDAGTDKLWTGLPKSFTGFHWHGDVFDLPDGAVSLASSDLTAHQAFRFGQNAYGFLFHMEVTATMIREWVRSFEGEMKQAGISEEPVTAGIETYLRELHSVGDTVYRRWAELL